MGRPEWNARAVPRPTWETFAGAAGGFGRRGGEKGLERACFTGRESRALMLWELENWVGRMRDGWGGSATGEWERPGVARWDTRREKNVRVWVKMRWAVEGGGGGWGVNAGMCIDREAGPRLGTPIPCLRGRTPCETAAMLVLLETRLGLSLYLCSDAEGTRRLTKQTGRRDPAITVPLALVCYYD